MAMRTGARLTSVEDGANAPKLFEGRELMNKSEVASRLAGRMGLSKSAAAAAVDAVFATIRQALANDEDVRIPRFGTFTMRSRAARPGRNPQTGESVVIPASKVPSFRTGKVFKNTTNDCWGSEGPTMADRGSIEATAERSWSWTAVHSSKRRA